MDRGAWGLQSIGAAQSWTWLKRLSTAWPRTLCRLTISQRSAASHVVDTARADSKVRAGHMA